MTNHKSGTNIRLETALVFCISAAVLILQLTQTRIFSVISWNHLVYFIITIALLGFGIGGTWLSFGTSNWLARLLGLRRSSILFFLSAIISSLLLPQLHYDNPWASARIGQLLRLLVVYSSAVLPYFFAGLVLGSVFRDHSDHIKRLYFFDLLGAAIGCLGYLLLIRPLGAANLVLVAATLPVLPIIVIKRQWHGMKAAVNLLLVMITGYLVLENGSLERGIKPEGTKALVAHFKKKKRRPVIESTEWNVLSRIDVARAQNDPNFKAIFIDGDAWTPLVPNPPDEIEPWRVLEEPMMWAASPYIIRPSIDSVLSIGVGGGHDILYALRAQAKKIDAVELNPTTAYLTRVTYSDFTNNLFNSTGVRLWNEEGRSFVRRSRQTYDLITMHGTDTFAALSSGAYVFSENYLYTIEAVRDYLLHLNEQGLIYIGRWLHEGETLRLFATVLEALHQENVKEPMRQVVVIANEWRPAWAMVLVKAVPFTERELSLLVAHQDRFGGPFLFPPVRKTRVKSSYQQLLYKYAKLREQEKQEAFFDSYSYDVRPVSDDNPFFFNYEKWTHIIAGLKDPGGQGFIRGHWPTITLFSLFTLAIIAVALFMLLPLIRLTKAKRGGLPVKSWLVYFACLGVAYIFVEIALLQRFALFLGHPMRSLAIILAGLLAATGIGSLWGGRLKIGHEKKMMLLVLSILVVAYVYPVLVSQMLAWPLWARGCITLVMIFPVGFLMGIPFPKGIEEVAIYQKDSIPWMWGVNGGATVLGSIAAIILAIVTNFTTVLNIASVLYLVGALAYIRK